MKVKGIVAVVATVLIVGDVVEIASDIALNWWQWTGIFAVGIAILFLWLHLTAEP